MFPEYRDVISQLKTTDNRFLSLFEKHNKLDHEIKAAESKASAGYNNSIEVMKKEKLRLKDEIYRILKNYEPA